MSDTYTDEEEAPPHPADPPQQLVDFVGAFKDPQAQEAFGEAAIRVQDYMTRRDIAADNAAAADRLVSNLGQFKDGLASMVRADPAAVDLGLDIVPDIVHGIVQTHPYLPDDQRDGIYDSLTTDIQREIARTGVMSLADRDAAAARSLLDNDRVSTLIAGLDRLGLEGYIGAMDTARTVDATAVAQQRAVDQQRDTSFAMTNYLGALIDPNTQEMQFPDTWAQRITADPSIPPAATAAMLGVYDRLQKGGDAERSDPYLVAGLIKQIASGEPPTVSEILNQAGEGLKLADAVGLARSSVGKMTPAARTEFTALDNAITAARTFIASPENGPAGQYAFGRFMDWFIGEYRVAPPGDLRSEGGLARSLPEAIHRFIPNGDDVIKGSKYMNMAETLNNGRLPLDQILGNKRAPPGDTVIKPRRQAPRMRMPGLMRGPEPSDNPETEI